MQQITPGIFYIGVDDDNLDLFEGQYPLTAGISYNSYLIADPDAVTIVDSVDSRRTTQWLESIRAVLAECNLPAPANIIIQHMEPDHSGSIAEFIEAYPGSRIICSAKAAAMLNDFFPGSSLSQQCLIVNDNQELTLGNTTLRFITAPMVHWPEVIVTLDLTHTTLFSADAFGTFGTWDDSDSWVREARRYYANIVGRFGSSVQTLLNKLRDLPFSIIAPLHGPMLTGNLTPYLTLYDRWSRYQPETRGVLVAYASIYGATARAARLLATMLRQADAGEVTLIDLARHHPSYAVAEAFRLSSMALCCATCDADLFPPMTQFLHHINAKKLRSRRVGLIENGSWAPAAARLMKAALSTMTDISILEPTVTIRSCLKPADMPALEALAAALARQPEEN